jgi:hypothetical protein
LYHQDFLFEIDSIKTVETIFIGAYQNRQLFHVNENSNSFEITVDENKLIGFDRVFITEKWLLKKKKLFPLDSKNKIDGSRGYYIAKYHTKMN